ncbi:hypothetical protein Bbelb_328470 [Branchiostoma belcheri]|nr:hypothetical protein Bbelb_328470 [Branchiostoma belcheri]
MADNQVQAWRQAAIRHAHDVIPSCNISKGVPALGLNLERCADFFLSVTLRTNMADDQSQARRQTVMHRGHDVMTSCVPSPGVTVTRPEPEPSRMTFLSGLPQVSKSDDTDEKRVEQPSHATFG